MARSNFHQLWDAAPNISNVTDLTKDIIVKNSMFLANTDIRKYESVTSHHGRK